VLLSRARRSSGKPRVAEEGEGSRELPCQWTERKDGNRGKRQGGRDGGREGEGNGKGGKEGRKKGGREKDKGRHVPIKQIRAPNLSTNMPPKKGSTMLGRE